MMTISCSIHKEIGNTTTLPENTNITVYLLLYQSVYMWVMIDDVHDRCFTATSMHKVG